MFISTVLCLIFCPWFIVFIFKITSYLRSMYFVLSNIRKNYVHLQSIMYQPTIQIICSTLFELENPDIHT